MMPKPKIINPFLVPHRFFSSQAMFPNVSARNQEKYTIDHPIHATANPMMICFAMFSVEEVSSG